MKKNKRKTVKTEEVSVKDRESRRISDEDLDLVSGGSKTNGYMGQSIKPKIN